MEQQASAVASGTSTPSGAASARKRAEATSTYVEQAWQAVGGVRQDEHADLEWAAAEGEDEEEWECVACGKSFRSEAAWDSHERSKKHLREVELLKQEMQEEQEELGLDEEESNDEVGEGDEERDNEEEAGTIVNEPPASRPPTPPREEEVSNSVAQTPGGSDDEAETALPSKGKKDRKKKAPPKAREPSPDFNEPEGMAKKGRKGRRRLDDLEVLSRPESVEPGGNDEGQDDDVNSPPSQAAPELSKKEKRRAKEAAKKAKDEEGAKSLVRLSDITRERSLNTGFLGL